MNELGHGKQHLDSLRDLRIFTLSSPMTRKLAWPNCLICDWIPQKKDDWFSQIRSLPVWQGILAALPLGLLLIGGMIGGLIGALGTVANLKIARTALAPTWKIVSMVGVVLGAVITYLLFAAVVANS